MYVNKQIILGRVGNDPDVLYAPSGTCIAKFSVATAHGVKVGEKWEEQTEWHKVVVFGKRAETVSEYVRKGHVIYIEGRTQTNAWEDKEGQKRYTTEVIADNVQLMPKSMNESAPNQSTNEKSAKPDNVKDINNIPQKKAELPKKEVAPEAKQPEPAVEEEDDLPF